VADSRPLLVYAPGLDGTGRLLFRQRRLHDEYDLRCIAYPQNRSHSYASLAELVAAPLKERGGGIVLAESFGGAVALTVALKYPELVRRLMLLNTFAWFPRRAYIEPLAMLGPYLPAKPSHPASRRLRGVFFFSPDVLPEDRKQWWDLTADVPMSAFGHRFGMIRDLDLRPRLHEVKAPTLVLAAPDDRVVAADAGVSLAKQLPNATLIQPRAGHAAMVHPRIDVAELLAQYR